MAEPTNDQPNAIDHQERKIDVYTRVLEGGKMGARVEREGGTFTLQFKVGDKVNGLIVPQTVAEAFRDMLNNACALPAQSVDSLEMMCAKEAQKPKDEDPRGRYNRRPYSGTGWD